MSKFDLRARQTFSWLGGVVVAEPLMADGTAVPFYPNSGETWADYVVFDGTNGLAVYALGEHNAQLLGNSLALAAQQIFTAEQLKEMIA